MAAEQAQVPVDIEAQLQALLSKKEYFKSCPPAHVDPLYWYDVQDDTARWKVVRNQLRTGQYVPTITNVTFTNDEASYASLATVEVSLDLANNPTIVIKFVELFKMYLSGDERTAALNDLFQLMNSLSSVTSLLKFASEKGKKMGKVKFGSIDASIPLVGLISNVTTKGETLTFVVQRHRNNVGVQQPRKLTVRAAASRMSPDGKHVVVKSDENTWSVFEVQPSMNKFNLAQIDLDELKRILALQV